MKSLLFSTALVAATTLPVMAETQDGTFRMKADPTEILASEFIGMRVYRSDRLDADSYDGASGDWDDIGEIKDLVLSREGKTEAVLVDIGGFLGIGENRIALDMNALRFVSDDSTADEPNDFFVVFNGPRALLEQAPTYRADDRDMAATGGDDQNGANASAVNPANEETQEGTDATHKAGTDVTAGDSANEDPQTAAVDTEVVGDPVPAERTPIRRDGYLPAEPVDLTAERLTGAPAYDAHDEWIGEVSEIILADGQVSSVVVDVGGFLGIGEKPVELPMTDIDILRDEDGADIRVYISLTEEQMKALPEYED
ncbi:MAG: PRC-barrel domain-containing protein [Sedimentitalea sp.]|nr:PRC-barrel domain-containing protein [Sedimentitalea sp.]